MKKIDSAKIELAKLIPKGNEQRAAALAVLETLCAAVEARVEALRRRKKTIEDLATAVKQHQARTELDSVRHHENGNMPGRCSLMLNG